MFAVAHLALRVKDIKISRDFYCQVLGCQIIGQVANEDFKICYLQTGALIIELLEFSSLIVSQSPGVYDHLAFQVKDIEQAIELLQKRGVCFSNEAPLLSINGQKIIFFTGPDGERIELVEN